jgi:hypothetical protein
LRCFDSCNGYQTCKKKIAQGSWRILVVAHRYLGIALGLLMLTWFASGIVMMYVGFPQPAGSERLRGLPAIAWADCCRVDSAACLTVSP